MKNLSNETIGCLRNCSLLDKGTYEGKTFVRCVPFKAGERLLPSDQAQAQAHRVVAEIAEEGVIVSWHDELGHYVQVGVDTRTFRLICYMKS